MKATAKRAKVANEKKGIRQSTLIVTTCGFATQYFESGVKRFQLLVTRPIAGLR